MKNKTYKIFRLDIARRLAKKGFHIEAVTPNKDKPWLNVYCFTDTENMRQALSEIVKEKRQERENYIDKN